MKMEKMKIRTRDMILLIISLPMQAKKLAIENPKYKNTLNELLKYDFYADERLILFLRCYEKYLAIR
jgi:hypothetical protein